MISFEVKQKIKEVLEETGRILFPLNKDISNLIKSHAWRDRKYVGEHNGRVVVWQGYSINFVAVDFRYRALFIDVVDNVLPHQERVRLFGQDFVNATAEFSRFVVMFVLDFPIDSLQNIIDQGFTPRKMEMVLHACIVTDEATFLSQTSLHWAAKTTRLVIFQRILSIHRKPLDSGEVPLQHLLYKTGYLHYYTVHNGLELHDLSRPRRSGGFGHDFHALVRNSKLDQNPFLLGIEMYTGPIGYHTDTIPQYINGFRLRGMMVIAKDNPFPFLEQVAEHFYLPIYEARNLSDVGTNTAVAIHYLSLDTVVLELSAIRDELETLIPMVHISK